MDRDKVKTEVLVVGGGAIGASVARHFALAGRQVILVDAKAKPGLVNSSRNSGVIHAGLYYANSPIKEKMCIRGKHLLYEYCRDKNVPFQQLGKLIVAQASEEPLLNRIFERAANNEVPARLLSGGEIQRSFPGLSCVAALKSPSTGIVDTQSLIQSLVLDFEAAGGLLHCHAHVLRIETSAGLAQAVLEDGTLVTADIVINSAGLNALRLVPPGVEHSYENFYLKGSYFSYTGGVPFKTLVYPLPSQGGLGIHLTLDLAGRARFGPDTLAVSHPDFTVRPQDSLKFGAAVKQYWPGCNVKKLSPDYAGIRPKLKLEGLIVPDFIFLQSHLSGGSKVVSLLGMDSPGLTSCLAVAEQVFEMT